MIDRRRRLSGTALVMVRASARAGTVAGTLPWAPGAGSPPQPVTPGPWHSFTPAEGRTIEAIVDRIILQGARSASITGARTGAGMPSQGWRLDDDRVVAVLTYIRNA